MESYLLLGVMLRRHSAYVMSLDFYAIKVDVMCSCDGYSEIIFWSINNGGIVQNFKGGSRHLRFQPRPGGHLAAASENDVKPQACVRRFEGHTKGSLCWDSSGNVLYLPLRRMQ
ncbi:transcriptional corepressor LEUNIG [Triticum aestivum]|uniref:transcriptional corepressor LEUNIG n=2 Tax=Triticum TaxID=4564 RepID=UPI001D019778|nr:transcriptional corepressor LEUNIG-like [Triticum aestivum]